MKDIKNYSLVGNNTFGIDVSCSRFLEYDSVDQLISLLPEVRGKKHFHIGGGSNLLFTANYDGIILHSNIKGIDLLSQEGDTILVRTGAAEVWDDFVAYCVEHSWHGAENLSLIPGEVGASAVQNIGAYGAEAKDIIKSVELVEIDTGRELSVDVCECDYAYRQSRFKREWKGKYVVTHVVYALNKNFSPSIEYGAIKAEIANRGIDKLSGSQLRDIIISIRRDKLPDPKELGNAGSFFMNPVVSQDTFDGIQKNYPDVPHYVMEGGIKVPAGWMIEQCGWKGKSMGNAAVYDKQALVLVNNGGASGEDIMSLSNAVCGDVKKRFGVDIHPEVIMI